MIYTFVNGQKKKIDKLYTFVNGQKKYIYSVDTFIENKKNNIYTPLFHPSFYILLNGSTGVDTLYVMDKEIKKITKEIKLPVKIYSASTRGYYNKQSKKLLLVDTDSKTIIIIDCRKNIVINYKKQPYITMGYNDELGLFYTFDSDNILHVFDLINDKQYDIIIGNLNFTNIITSSIIKKDNKPYFIVGGYNTDTNSIFYYIDISNKESIIPILYDNQPSDENNRGVPYSTRINPYITNINTPFFYTRGDVLGYSTFLNLVKFNNYVKINIGSQNGYRFLGYCSSMGYIFKLYGTNNFYYCNPNTNKLVLLNIDLADAKESTSNINFNLAWSDSLNLNVSEDSNQFNYILCSNGSPRTLDDKSIGLICTGGIFKKFNIYNIYNTIGFIDCSDESNIYFLTSSETYGWYNTFDNFITGVHLENSSSNPVVTKYELPVDFYNKLISDGKYINKLFVSY